MLIALHWLGVGKLANTQQEQLIIYFGLFMITDRQDRFIRFISDYLWRVST